MHVNSMSWDNKYGEKKKVLTQRLFSGGTRFLKVHIF